MKKFRKILVLVLIFAFVIGGNVQAFAATYDAEDETQLVNAVNDYDNHDGEMAVTVNVKNDLDMAGSALLLKDGYSYTINNAKPDGSALNISSLLVNNREDSTNPGAEEKPAEFTVNADLSSPENSNKSGFYSKGSVNTTVNGDISAEGNAPAVKVNAENSSASLTVNGNLTTDGKPAVDAYAIDGDLDITVNGNIEGGGYEVYALDFNVVSGYAPEYDETGRPVETEKVTTINIEHNGDIHTSSEPEHGGDAVSVYDDGNDSRVDVTINGNVSCDDPNAGIFACGSDGESEINVTVDGELNCGAYTYEYNKDRINVVQIRRTAGSNLNEFGMNFETETLDGEKFTQADMGAGILVFFDPADEGSVQNLVKAQKLADRGQNIVGVCITGDYEAAKAVAEENSLSFKIVKNCDGLRAAMATAGIAGSQAALLIGGCKVIGASKSVDSLAPFAGGAGGVERIQLPVQIREMEAY